MHFCLSSAQIISNIVNNILRPKNEIGWNATQPSGTEGDNLMQVMHRFADAIFRSLYYHIIDGRTVWTKAKISQYHEYIGNVFYNQYHECMGIVIYSQYHEYMDRVIYNQYHAYTANVIYSQCHEYIGNVIYSQCHQYIGNVI